MKKNILKIIAVIIVISIAVLGYFVFTGIMQENKLKAELTALDNLVNSENVDFNKLEEIIERTVTKGDYAVVEKAFKNYLNDNFENTIKINDILNDEKITNLLTIENYKADGKDFTETKNYIKNTIDSLENCKKNYKDFFTEEKAMSYINDKGLSGYYINFYKQELVGDIESIGTDKTVENSIDEVISLLNISNEIIEFLADNQNGWYIDGENIVFENKNLLDEYNALTSRLP